METRTLDSSGAAAAPVSTGERIELLDVVRGFALFGVLVGNLLWTGTEVARSDAQLAALPTAGIDRWADALWVLFGADKANTLFAFLFGVGFAIQLERGARRGGSTGSTGSSGSSGSAVLRYARRIGVLFLIGVAHNFLLWFGDVLHLYAVTGLLLIPMRRASNRTLVVAGLLFALFARPAFHFVTHSVPPVAAYFDSLPEFYSEARREERGEMFLSGSYRDVLAVNAAVTLDDWILTASFMGWTGYVFGRFLLGFWTGRNRYLEDPGRFADGWRRLLRVALPLGLAGNAWNAALELTGTDLEGAPGLLSSFVVQVGIVALAAAYLAAIALLHLGSETWRMRLAHLAPVGRMALTNYLAQSFLIVFGLYAVGLGLLDDLGATGLWVLGAVFFVLQILASRWWLARFEFGPVEWLWRALTYGRRPPFRRGAPLARAA